MYEKGKVSICEKKKIPRMFHLPSHFESFLIFKLVNEKLNFVINKLTSKRPTLLSLEVKRYMQYGTSTKNIAYQYVPLPVGLYQI